MQKINVSRFREADYQRTVWQATAEQGMTPEDLQEPAAWGNVANQLRPFHRIEVLADNAAWWAEYLVTDCTNLWAKVHLLRKVEFGKVEQREPQKAGYQIKYRGAKKWSVLREDNAVIKDGFDTREAAEEHMASHVKAMAA